MGQGILQVLEEMKRQLHAMEKQNKVKIKKSLESQALIVEREDPAAFPQIWMDDLQSWPS